MRKSSESRKTIPEKHVRFVRNWIVDAPDSRSLRRRLIAALRMACRTLGLGRKRLAGLTPGAMGAILLLGGGAAHAQYNAGTGSATDFFDTRVYDRNNPGNPGTAGLYYRLQPVRSTAVGQNSYASGGGVALGDRARVDMEDSIGVGVAIGAYSYSLNAGVAIGAGVLSTGNHAIAMGRQAGATGNYSSALGAVSWSQGAGSVAVGHGSYASDSGAIAIGGQTSGVNWSNNEQTRAQGVGAIALGNKATTDGDQTLALGSNATANHLSSVALGAGSRTATVVGTQTMTIGGVTHNLAGGAPIATVSIGDVGAERTITNVGAGRVSETSTDGINGSQLHTTNLHVEENANAINNISDGVDDLARDALLWDEELGAFSADHGGATPSKITNTAEGEVNEGSTDAVNGSQLHTTNQKVDENTTIIKNVDGRVTNVEGDITNIGEEISDLEERAVKYDRNEGGTVNKDQITLEGGSGTKITNVAKGEVSTDSTDAVNGSQLHATDQKVEQNTTNIENIDKRINNAFGDINVETYGEGIRYARTNETGLEESDAFATGQGATAVGYNAEALGESSLALGRGAKASDDGSVAIGAGSVADGETLGKEAYLVGGKATGEMNVGDRRITGVAAGAEDDDAANVSQLKAVESQIGKDVDTLAQDALLWDDHKKAYSANHVSTVDPNKITNLAEGEVSDKSLDAINGKQLYGVSNSIATHLGGGATVSQSGIVTPPTYVIASINENGEVKEMTHNNVGDALGGLSETTENINTHVNKIDEKVNNINEEVGSLDEGAVKYDVDDKGGADKSQITLEGENGTTITNLAEGDVSEKSTDAVTGAQLHGTNQRVEKNTKNIAKIDGRVTTVENDIKTIGNGVKNAVQYDVDDNGGKTNDITLEGSDPNAPVLIKNVAEGEEKTDAVNVGQLQEEVDKGIETTLKQAHNYTDQKFSAINTEINQMTENTLNEANAYTDQKFSALNSQIGDVRKEARQAAAIGLAAASLRYDDRPGKLSVAVGGGYWKSESAFAAGLGYTSENGRVRANVSGVTAGGDVGVGAGLSITLN